MRLLGSFVGGTIVLWVTLSPATAYGADMRVVCEERTGMFQRLDIRLPDGGEPVLEAGVGDATEMFMERPRVLSHVLTSAGVNLQGGPFSTIHVEFKVADEQGVTRIYAPQTYYVDWDRAKVWKSFFSLLDMPGSSEVLNCVRVD